MTAVWIVIAVVAALTALILWQAHRLGTVRDAIGWWSLLLLR